MAIASRTAQQPQRPRLLQAMVDSWAQQDVRAKLLFVFAMLVVFRFVAHVPEHLQRRRIASAERGGSRCLPVHHGVDHHADPDADDPEPAGAIARG